MEYSKDLQTCFPCIFRNLTKPSVVYCSVCEESLCNDCKEHHTVSKLHRDHKLLAIDDYCRLPPLVQRIKQFCETHGDVLEFFCQSHDEVCCKRCATTTHSKCNESVKLLQDLIGTSINFPSFDDISHSLADIEVNTNAAIMDRERNMEDLAGQKQTILQNITLQRKRINEHLDKQESQVKGQLDMLFDQTRTNISKTIRGLRDRHTQIEEIKGSIQQIKQCQINSIPYLFICKRVINSNIEKLESEIKSEYECKTLLNTCLDYRVEKTAVDVARDIATSFGEIITKVEKFPRFTLKTRLPKAAQISAYQQNFIQKVKLSLKNAIALSDVRDIRSCTVRNDGSVILADSQMFQCGQLIKISQSKEDRIKMTVGDAFDIVKINENIIAVSTGSYGKRIDIFDENIERLRSISLDTWCYAATVQDKFIIFCSGKNKIGKICTQTGRGSSFTYLIDGLVQNTYLTSDESHIYISNAAKNTVICIDNNGKDCWTFNKPDELKSPRGITIDTNSNLYVTGFETNNVVMISLDGQSHREILSYKDGLDRPQAIYFDKKRSQLLVCNVKGPVFLFQQS